MGLKSWFSSTSIGKFIYAPYNWWTSSEAVEGELVAAYFTGVKIISDNFAKMHPQVLDANNKLMEGHALNETFIHQPNSYLNRQKFWKQVEAKRMNQGNAYAYVDRKNGETKGLHVLSNDSIAKASLKTSGTLYYEVDFDLSPMVPFTGKRVVRGEDLLHLTFGQNEGIFGIPALDVLSLQTDIISRAQNTINSFYKNNATSTMALETTIDRASIATKFNEAADDFSKKYTGEQNAGKPIRLPPNTKIVPIGQKFVDAQVIETQRFAREEIANLFGIPKSMFEATDNNESIEQQTRMFLALTLTPIIEAYIAELESKLLTAEEVRAGVHIEFNTEKLIETDIKTKAEIVTMQVTKGIMTPNEGAQKMGNNPIEGIYGNLHWVQTQNKPLEYYDQWEEDKNIIKPSANEEDSKTVLEGDNDLKE